MKNKVKKIFLVLFLLVVANLAFGLSSTELELCFSSEKLDAYRDREGDDAYQRVLEKCEDYLDEMQKQYEEDIERTEEEKRSLQNQIATLENRINQLDQQIKQSEVRIRSLGLEIQDTQGSIRIMNNEIEESRSQISEILKMVDRENEKSILEILITEDDLSGFFNNLTSLERLSEETQKILEEIRALRNSLETEEEQLAREREEAQRTAEMQAMQKAENQDARQEHARLYDMTEAEYQQQLEDKEFIEERASEIRERIFELAGLPDDVDAPTFEEAYEIAKWVERETGVRPAFLLSILQQESALGRNVGQCYLVDTSSGVTTHIRNGQRFSQGIHPTRDIPHFLTITEELGRDPLETPVSCTLIQGGREVGWGGAMGPAQFIPSTWQSVRSSVRSILGREPDPWSIRDSFMASGVLLSQNGASARTTSAEWNAAMIYFTGGTTNSSFFWYADQVINRADQFERDIEIMTR